LARALPEGLRDLRLTWRVEPSEIKYSELFKLLSGQPGSEVHKRYGVRGLAFSDSQYPRCHAHILVSPPLGRSKRYWFYFDVYPTRAKSPKKGSITLSSAVRDLQPYLKPERGTLFGGLVGRFTLRAPKWEPTIPIPFTAPGVLEGVPGSPKIVGVDFEFGDRGQSLRRGFVSASEQSREIRVEFFVALAVPFDDNLVEAMIREASKDLPVFARKVAEVPVDGA
jgi:hypothetical protein